MTKHSNTIFFCHGAPGSPDDAKLLQTGAIEVQVVAPNMFNLGSDNVIDGMIDAFDRSANGVKRAHIHVVGFSIGAMVAIKVAAARSNQIATLTLISAAAPLQLGNFLPDMAGKPVFDLAKRRPKTLKVLTKAQGLMSAAAPHFLINQLFGKCGDLERELLTDATFRDVIMQGLNNSFRQNPNTYINLLQSYVSDWSAELERISCPVEIWHGDKDTWSPLPMAHALVEAFPSTPKLHIVKNAEHYSTLKRASL